MHTGPSNLFRNSDLHQLRVLTLIFETSAVNYAMNVSCEIFNPIKHFCVNSLNRNHLLPFLLFSSSLHKSSLFLNSDFNPPEQFIRCSAQMLRVNTEQRQKIVFIFNKFFLIIYLLSEPRMTDPIKIGSMKNYNTEVCNAEPWQTIG